MSDITIDEALTEKQKVEKQIVELLNNFSYKINLPVTGIDMKFERFDSGATSVVSVKLEVKL